MCLLTIVSGTHRKLCTEGETGHCAPDCDSELARVELPFITWKVTWHAFRENACCSIVQSRATGPFRNFGICHALTEGSSNLAEASAWISQITLLSAESSRKNKSFHIQGVLSLLGTKYVCLKEDEYSIEHSPRDDSWGAPPNRTTSENVAERT